MHRHSRPHLAHPKYRSDIDGLRALAIIPVVLFHAFPRVLPGGFVGVDIFFVISGFLISSIIFSSLERDRFSLVEFYARRIRRIFPALIVVLAASLGIGWLVLFADEYEQLGMHAAAGAASILNFILWGESGYLEGATESKPLMHLWSLAVEDQFYIVYPLLLVTVWKRQHNFLKITACIGLASFAANIYLMHRNPTAAFYFPVSRFWELMLGGVLAYAVLHRPERIEKHKNGQSALGFLLIAVALWSINTRSEFPGFWALLPTLGAFFIIAAGPDAWLNKKFLSNRLMVGIGLISYPLYLWHWLLLSFGYIISVSSDVHRILLIAASFILAVLTFRFVEKPFRGLSVTTVAASLTMALVAATGSTVNLLQGVPGREGATPKIAFHRFPFPYRHSCSFLTGEVYQDDWCGTNRPTATTVLIGDSFSNVFSPTISFVSENYSHFDWIQFARGQCPSTLEYGPSYCRNISAAEFNYVTSHPQVRTVILALDWKAYFGGKDFSWIRHDESGEAFRDSVIRTIDAYRGAGRRVVVVLSPPTGSHPRDCVERPLVGTIGRRCNLPKSQVMSEEAAYRNWLLPLLKYREVSYFDPLPYLCPGDYCLGQKDGRVFSVDGSHLSTDGAQFLAVAARSELTGLLAPKAE